MDATDANSPALPWLYGGRVQRADGPAPGCFALTLFDRGAKQTLILLVTAPTRGVGALQARPKGEAASAFVQRLRTHIEGARLRGAAWLRAGEGSDGTRAHALLLIVERGGETARIVADFDARSPNLYLLRADGTIAGAADERARRERFPMRDTPYAPRSGPGIATVASADELFATGATLLRVDAARSDDGARAQARFQARAQLKRADRKASAIAGDLARADTAPRLRREAQALLCHLADVPRGASQVSLLDETVEPAEWLDITLDPALDANHNAQQRFDRARKAERGVAIATARLAETEALCARLRAFLALLDDATPLELLGGEAETLGIAVAASARAKRAPKQPKARVSYRVFVGTGDKKILVGKGAADNDTLTLTVARPHDVWLHARGSAGAHVVVPLDRKATIDQALLLDAAHLAAHFSKQRGEPTIEIAHTERRFVRKPKGAAPGSVNVDRERVFVLRLERERLQRLLASERV